MYKYVMVTGKFNWWQKFIDGQRINSWMYVHVNFKKIPDDHAYKLLKYEFLTINFFYKWNIPDEFSNVLED